MEWCKIQHFKFLFIFMNSAFIFVQNSTPIFIFNSYICSQNYYPFRNYLSIQQFLFKIYCASLLRMEVTYFLQRMNRGQRRSASDHWNLEKIPTAFAVQWGKAPPIRTFKTFPDYSPTMFTWLFVNLFLLTLADSLASNQRKMQRNAVHDQKN